MAMSYSLSWVLIFVPLILNTTRSLPPYSSTKDFIASTSLIPLQGLFNLIVYMMPKMRSAKNNTRRSNLTCFQAIRKAWMSKGEMRRNSTRDAGGTYWKQLIKLFTSWLGRSVSFSKQRLSKFIEGSER